MSVTIASVVDPLLARCEGCPKGFAIEAMRDAAIEFCRETAIHTTWVQSVIDGTQVPRFDMVEQVFNIVDARNNDPLADYPEIRVLGINDHDEVDELQTGEYAIQFVDPNNITVTPAPTPEAPLTVNLLLSIGPGPDATDLHEDLWRAHHEALRHGALARLYAELGKPWANPDAAGYRRGMFEAAIRKTAALVGRNRKQRAQRLRVTPSKF
jgi:hypothetical protein